MSNNKKVTLHLSKYLRCADPASVENLSRSLKQLAARNFEFHTLHDIQELLAKKGSTYITVSERVPRSRPQESYYRKWCRAFAEFCGMTPDEMHNEMLYRTFGTIEVETKLGWRKRPNKRSATTTKQEFSNLIDTLIRTAAEMGFNVPPAHRADHDEEIKSASGV